MSNRSRTWLVVALISILVACVGLFWFLREAPGVTPRNVAAIQPGMTRNDVEERMGGPPPGPLPADIAVEALPDDFVAKHSKTRTGFHWVGRTAAVFIVFDGGGRVTEVHPLKIHRMVAQR